MPSISRRGENRIGVEQGMNDLFAQVRVGHMTDINIQKKTPG